MYYVINLKRRCDRLQEFDKKFDKEYIVEEGIDGSLYKINKIPNEDNILNGIKSSRECGKILSHYNVWKKIANDDKNEWGIVFEDDVCFSPDWYKCSIDFNSIGDKFVYLGMSDTIPLHTKIPNEQMLRAQNKSHIKHGTLENNMIGIPKEHSIYIEDEWITISYFLSKNVAKKLIYLAKTLKIDKKLGIWLKEQDIDHRVFSPLYTFHRAREDIDSDIKGEIQVVSNINELKKKKIFFMIWCKDIEKVKECIDSILKNTLLCECYFGLYFNFSFSREINKYLKEIEQTKNVTTICGNYKSQELIFNNLWKTKFLDCDLFTVWNENCKVSEIGWDKKLIEYDVILGKPKIVIYKCLDIYFISQLTLRIMNFISPTSNIYLFLKYLSESSGICVNLEKVLKFFVEKEDEDDFYKNKFIKYHLDKSILNIINNSEWINCGKPL